MNLAARTMAGLLLGLVCLADVGLVMVTNDRPTAGLPALATSPPSEPVRSQAAEEPPQAGQITVVGDQFAIQSQLPAFAPTGSSTDIKVGRIRSAGRRPRRHAHAPVELAQENASIELAQEKSPSVSDTVVAAVDPPAAVPPAAQSVPAAPPQEQPASVVMAGPDVSRPGPVATETPPPGDLARVADATPDAAGQAPPLPSLMLSAKEDRPVAETDSPKAPGEAPQAGRSPTSVEEHLAHGSQLMRQGRSKEAIVDFEKATELDPTSAGARAGLAMAEAWSDEGAAAAIDLDKAVALNPKEPLVYDGRAVIAQKNGRAAEAIADYGQALALDPADEFARDQQNGLDASAGRPDPTVQNNEPRHPAVPDP
jgi:Tetratricopeptide repeat